MAQSRIEWTEATWNPVTGCTRASDGCDLCYAVTMTRRLAAMGSEKYVGLVNPGKGHFNGVTRTHPASLSQPFRRHKATVWFVNSMSDLFHPGVPFEFVAAVFGVMGATPQHTYQVLTKRPERAAAFFEWLDAEALRQRVRPADVCADAVGEASGGETVVEWVFDPTPWPLPNVWVGTSVEDERVTDRIEALRTVPAAVRFLSCEPLIGPLDLRGRLDGIGWVIVGGESGQGARPMRAEWAEAIQIACAEADVAYFFKQTGRVLARELGLGETKGSKAEAWPDHVAAIGGRAFPEPVLTFPAPPTSMESVAYRWHPIEDLPADTSPLEAADLRALAPLWIEQRERLSDSRALADFNERFHRRWAVETGLIERLYQFDEGITVLLVEQGFDAALLPHGASDKPAEQVARILRDQQNVVEGLFDFVASRRPLTTSYINELHAALTANQHTTDALTPDGQIVQVPLRRGAYKETSNNPTRADGQTHEYCPPVHVSEQMERLVALHAAHENNGVSPDVSAAWLHHAFTQIHPYQDGNGRVARALASLVFIRAGWFPLIVTTTQRDVYLDALQAADEQHDLQPLIGLFARAQQRAFRKALSVAEELETQGRQEDALIAAWSQSLQTKAAAERTEWNQARTLADALMPDASDRLQRTAAKLQTSLGEHGRTGQPYGFFADDDHGDPQRALWHQIPVFETANHFDYYANLAEYVRWSRLVARIGGRSELLISFHALGYTFQGAILVTATTYRRNEGGDAEHAIADIAVTADEPFQIVYTEDLATLQTRFSRWLDAVLVRAIDTFRRGHG